MTKEMMARIERVNGFGWFIHALWTAVLIGVSAAGLYWGVIGKIDSVEVRANRRADNLEANIALYRMADSLQSEAVQGKIGGVQAHLSDLWKRSQAAHKEMMRRVGQRWDWEQE